MTAAERELLLVVAKWIAAENPDNNFGSTEVWWLHHCIKVVEDEQVDKEEDPQDVR